MHLTALWLFHYVILQTLGLKYCQFDLSPKLDASLGKD